MNSKPAKLRSQHSLKSELIYSIPISILSAHAFVVYQQKENLFDILHKTGYFLAFAVSFSIAFLLILIVKYTTWVLDRKQPWEVNKKRRSLLQFFFGFVLALIMEWAMSSAYFLGHGYSISETIWADSYLLPISMYIILINLYYNSSPPIATAPAKSDEIAEPAEMPPFEKTTKEAKVLTEEDAVRIINRAVDNNVVLLSTSNKKVYAMNKKGEHVLWHDTIANSIAVLASHDYFLVNRSYILHRSIISQLQPDPENHQLTLILHLPFKSKIGVPEQGILDFEEWWNKKSV